MAEIIEEQNVGKILKKSGDKAIIVINNPHNVVFQLDSSALKQLPKLFFDNGMDIIREDIAPAEAIVFNNIKENELLRTLRPYLSGEYYGAFSYACYLIKREDKGEDIREPTRKLFEAYGPKGMRIYSLLRSKILEQEILPLVRSGEDREKISAYITKMIVEPEAIFVSFSMSKENIKEKIEDTFSKGINSFPIFARVSGIKLAIDAVNEIIDKANCEIAYRVETYMLGKTDAATIWIQKF